MVQFLESIQTPDTKQKTALTPDHERVVDYTRYLTGRFARRYLATYFKCIDADERAIAEFLVREYQKINGKPEMLDLGCGPGMQHVLPVVPYVSHIDMADFLPDNLTELRQWQARHPDSHNWQHFTKLILELEGKTPSPTMIEEREQELRNKLRCIQRADVLQDLLLDEPRQYPVVGFFYCAEAASRTKEQWAVIMARVAKLVQADGFLFMASLRNATYYTVDRDDGTAEHIPCASVDENDFVRLLPQLGFDQNHTQVIVAPTPDMVDHGIQEILLVSAKKQNLKLPLAEHFG